MNGLDCFLINRCLSPCIVIQIAFQALMLFIGWSRGINAHQKQRVLVMLLNDLQGLRRLDVDVLLDLLDGLSVLLLVHDVALLLKTHLVL